MERQAIQLLFDVWETHGASPPDQVFLEALSSQTKEKKKSGNSQHGLIWGKSTNLIAF